METGRETSLSSNSNSSVLHHLIAGTRRTARLRALNPRRGGPLLLKERDVCLVFLPGLQMPAAPLETTGEEHLLS